METLNIKLIAKPLLTINKERKITAKRAQDGKIYLFITPKRYIGSGATLDDAIQDSALRVWTTGYMAQKVEA